MHIAVPFLAGAALFLAACIVAAGVMVVLLKDRRDDLAPQRSLRRHAAAFSRAIELGDFLAAEEAAARALRRAAAG